MVAMDWDSDPELRKLRDEFVASLQARKTLLQAAIESLLRSSKPEETLALLKNVQHIAHKLGGAAASYGFPALSKIAGDIDDFLDCPDKQALDAKDSVKSAADGLVQAIELAQQGRDAGHLANWAETRLGRSG